MTTRQSLGRHQCEGTAHISQSLFAFKPRLTGRETAAEERCVVNRYASDFGYSYCQHLALVEPTLETAHTGDGHWHYYIHSVEESLRLQHLGGMAPHEDCNGTPTIVFHPINQLSHVAMRMKLKQCISPDHIATTKDTPHHHIVGAVGE